MNTNIEIPSRIKKLQRNEKGYPVPWFVQWIDGKPDFRVMDSEHLVQAVRYKLCWICGEPLGRFKAFVIGPMCAVNRTSGEPPSHKECAVFAAMVCPFLTEPKRTRRETNLPENQKSLAGIAIARNPGVALVWVVTAYELFKVPHMEGAGEGMLFDIGDPVETLWFAEGREATREEVMASFESGLPILQKEAIKGGEDNVKALFEQYKNALDFVPA